MSASNLPILKPRELIRALERMGFRLPRSQRAAIGNSSMRTDAGPPFQSIKGATLARACCERFSATLNWVLTNSRTGCEGAPAWPRDATSK